MYARTKNGILGMIVNANSDEMFKGPAIEVNERIYCVERDSIKDIKENIINLIEVGDYVNGEKVIEVHVDLGYIFVDKETELGTKTFCDYQIESIVTKQQFESIEYKI